MFQFLTLMFLGITVSSAGIIENSGEIASTNNAIYTAATSLRTMMFNHWQPLVLISVVLGVFTIFRFNR